MALEGTLEEFNIVAVLQMLSSGGMTGTLTVQDGSTQNLVSFAEGCVVQAYSTLQDDHLGEILVRTHRLARPQLEQATAYWRGQSGQSLGQILLNARLIARHDLVMAVQIQILEIMSKLLLWSRGQWRFDFGPPDPNGVAPAEGMSVDEILSGQMLLLDTLEPQYDGSEVLEEVYVGVVHGRPDPARTPPERDEWRVLRALDGRRSGYEIAYDLSLDPDHVAHILTDLVAAGSIAPQPSTPEPPPPPPAAGPVPAPVHPPAAAPAASPGNPTVVVSADTLERVNNVLSGLLSRTEAHETCLVDSSGSLITRRGTEVHRTYPTLFALVAGIFASWQELGRSLGESKASTLLYQGEALNICLTPVGTQTLLMTLYQSASDSGLVNFWNREASGRILRLLTEGANAAPAGPAGPRPYAPDPNLPTDYQSDAERAMDNLLRSK